jgi:1-acyl-sn-glycerol-3-phosphate acyltransferase
MTNLPRSLVRKLTLQTLVDWLAFPVIGTATVVWMRFVRRYRFPTLEQARRTFAEARKLRRPILICANHLTMADSLLMHHALASLPSMLAEFGRCAWNVPAIENFKKSFGLRLFTYLGKTIPIDRSGTGEHHREILDQLAWLMERGDACVLFPEGGRSRTGFIEPEKVTYGVGQLLARLDDPLVVCVYLRGRKQTTWSDLPAADDDIHVEVRLLEPRTTETGLRAARDLSRQVILALQQMEERYKSLPAA